MGDGSLDDATMGGATMGGATMGEVDAPEPPASDPLADLLFTLIAAVLPAILLLAPLTQRTSASARDRSAESARAAARAGATLDGARVTAVIAGADGVRLGAGGRLVALDRIPDDAELRKSLATMKQADAPLVLVVEPDGAESAFLLEPVLAADGPRRVEEVRMTEPCGPGARAPLAALCAAPP